MRADSAICLKRFAKRLEYLEAPRTQTAADFAVDALQDAFMGLTSGQYDWGKKGFPTRVKASSQGGGGGLRSRSQAGM